MIYSDVLPESDIILEQFERRVFGDKIVGSVEYTVFDITKAASTVGEYLRNTIDCRLMGRKINPAESRNGPLVATLKLVTISTVRFTLAASTLLISFSHSLTKHVMLL
jgi:hypothetical protein